MAQIWREPYLIVGSKMSVGAFDQGYFGNAAIPTTALDIFGGVRFRGNISLTDSRLNWGGETSQTGGNGAVVFGAFNSALGYNSISQGRENAVYSNNSIAVGRGLTGCGESQAMFGQYNVANASNVLLVVGDGRDAGNRSDALTVYNNGTVHANALSMDGGISILNPSYVGPLVEARLNGIRQGCSTGNGTTFLYGPTVQLGTTGNLTNNIQPHLTISNVGTEIDSDCVFYGNVTIVGQTFSTVTQTYTTVASSVEVSDPIITVGHKYAAQANAVATYDIGLVGERPSANTGVIWDESRGEWAFIHTAESSEAMEYQNFSYGNLHVNNLSASKLTTTGPTTQTGDLTLIGSASMNSISISNNAVLAGPLQCQSSVVVNGPSVLNTVFVANQAVFNNALLPTEPDSWPIGQVNNRFSRAYVDTIDVYDSLNLPGPRQDTYPAKIGAFGEANIYLYTTSPAYLDTVGIYFDKGQSQLPYGKSAIVQEYDHWSLRTQGINRLTANTVTGNLQVANELVVVDNLTSYGAQVWLVNNVWTQGAFQGNTGLWSNATVYGGNLTPRIPNRISIGTPAQRFANAFLNTLDLYQPGNALASTLTVGSADNTNLYVYSSNSCTITLNNLNSGKSSLLQDQSTFNILGVGGINMLSANVLTANTVLSGDQLLLGNSKVSGQSLLSAVSVSGAAAFNTATFSSSTTYSGNVTPSQANVINLGNAQSRFNTAFLNGADLYGTSNKPLRVGSSLATNVYIYSDSSSPVSLTMDQGGNASPTAKMFLQQTSNNAVIGVNNTPRITIDNLTGNLYASNDAVIGGNLSVQGPVVSVNNLNVYGNVTGNAAYWANASVFQGPLLCAASNTVSIGNTSSRFQQASLQRLDVYDTNAIRAGSNGSTNVFMYADSVAPTSSVSINFDQGGVSKSAMTQNVTSWTLSTLGQPRLVANIMTGNVWFSGDVIAAGNLQSFGQSSTLNNDLRVLGHFAGNSAFWSNGTVVDGSITTFTPNTCMLASQNNRFAAAYLNHANVYNQSGAPQRIGSTQTANLCLFTDSPNVGQTATIMFDKAGGGKSAMGQDGKQWFLVNNGNTALTANSVNCNLYASADVVVGSNLTVYGQTVAVTSDLNVLNRMSANTLSIANCLSLASNVIVTTPITIGNTGGRFSNIFCLGCDVYGPALIGGGGSAQLSLVANNSVSDPGQTASIFLAQSLGSNSSLQQGANALTISTQNMPRLSIANGGNVNIFTSAVIQGNAALLGPVLTAAGNVGVQGQQSRWPLDFNAFSGEKTIGFANTAWLGSNASTRDLVYQTNQSHRFYTATTPTVVGNPVLTLLPNAGVVAYGNMQPAVDMAQDVGSGLTRWRQLVAGNLYASYDSTFNGAVIGNLGVVGAIGLASNSQPSNSFAFMQHPSGNTFVNSAQGGSVKLCTANAVGAIFSGGKLRVGDANTPGKCLEVAQDSSVGGVVYASQSSGFASNPTLFNSNAGGWIQLGNLTTAPGSSMKLSLLGQSNLGNSTTFGGESIISVCTSATNVLSGSWYNTGFQQAISQVKSVQTSGNTYTLYAVQGSNTTSYAASATLTNATFSHASLASSDPGTGNLLPQQYILNGFSVIGNSVGVLSNAIGGQPWLFNGNNIYSQYQNVGIGTVTPSANLDVKGSIAFTGQLISNGSLLPATQIIAVSNAFVSNAADTGLLASRTGIAYPSSLRIGDSSPPSGVLEVVQSNGAVKIGGMNGGAGDLSFTGNTAALNLTGATVQGWKFNKLATYSDLASKTTLATIDGTGAYIQTSDRRFKRDISDVDHATALLFSRLRPRRYQVEGSARPKYGFIAQEVRDIMPELVHEDEAGFLSIDYSSMIPLMFALLADKL